MPPPAQGEAGFWQVKIRLENVPMDVGLIGLQFSGINYDGVECRLYLAVLSSAGNRNTGGLRHDRKAEKMSALFFTFID